MVASRLSSLRDISSTVKPGISFGVWRRRRYKESVTSSMGRVEGYLLFPIISLDRLLNLELSWFRRSSTTATSSDGAVSEVWGIVSIRCKVLYDGSGHHEVGGLIVSGSTYWLFVDVEFVHLR